MLTTTRQSVTTSDLEGAGLSAEQMARLVEMKERYSPFRELFNAQEFQRLSFLRWQVEQGQVGRG